MSGSSRSRQKRKLEPISIEELAGTTGMSGFCSFLTRDASVSVPVLDALESSAPETVPVEPSAPVSAPLESSTIDSPAQQSSAPGTSRPITSAPELSPAARVSIPSAPQSSAPEPDALDYPALDYSPQRRPRIRETSTVQDGHSLAEQAVYDVMYRAGKPYQGESRILTIGLRTLAEMSRMAYSNCKANVRSLVEKLAIDERDGFSYTQGRTYVVYSFREILRRRKAAGLTHVIRSRGVAFVDPATSIPLTHRGLAESSAPYSTASVSSAPGPSASAPEPAESSALPGRESSAPATSAHIENRHLLRNPEEPSSSALEAIVSALRSHIPDTDDDAAISLWHRCRENAPAAAPSEIVHFIHLKAGKPGIRMPLGFLLTAVPKCFQGDSYRQFLEERRRHQDAQSTRDRRFAEEILKSPDADQEQREWAREVLGLTATPQ
jgi:hypothetical protein